MKIKKKNRLARSLIALGATLAVLGLAYEALHFPWRALLDPNAVPADPAPVGSWITESSPTAPLDALPGDPDDVQNDADLKQAGVIKIPKLAAADNIVEGVDAAAMRGGIGHWPGTALPGQAGNCVLAGHRPRDLLRHLDRVEAGDTILLSDQQNVYTYTVFDVLTVEPTALWITEPVDGRDCVLTLFTCTPYLVSTHRLVVQAECTATVPRPAD